MSLNHPKSSLPRIFQEKFANIIYECLYMSNSWNSLLAALRGVKKFRIITLPESLMKNEDILGAVKETKDFGDESTSGNTISFFFFPPPLPR